MQLEFMRLPELWAKYTELTGRPTRCPNKRFLITEIQRLQPRPKPRARTRAAAPPPKVLPVRFDAATVEALDAAWKRHGVASRMEFFRRAIHRELTALGEREAAERFGTPSEP